MKKQLVFIAALLFSIQGLCSDDLVEETKEKDGMKNIDLRKQRVSYSIGYDFGLNVVKRLDNLDLEIFIAGLRHAYNDEFPKLKKGEMEFIIADYKREISRRAKINEDNINKNNLLASNVFFEENQRVKDVIGLSSGLQYKILRKGHGKKPILGDKVKVNYKGTFISGLEFDNTYLSNTPEFALTAQMLPGLVEGLMLMAEGGRWQIFIPPNLAYGERGQNNAGNGQVSIEPNTTLIFDIELIEVFEPEFRDKRYFSTKK